MAAVSTSGLREYADHRATFSGAKRASYVVNHPPNHHPINAQGKNQEPDSSEKEGWFHKRYIIIIIILIQYRTWY